MAWLVLVMALLLAGSLRAPAVAAERHVAAAAGHVCVVLDGGGVACRGNATTTGKLDPPSGVAFHAVTVGDDFTCGLTTNGSLRCWGALPGGASQLPPPSTFFIDAHAGPRHVCGLVPDGAVACYGNATSRGAISVPAGVAFQGVSAGTDYTCGVARNHSVVCWGESSNPVVANASVWRAINDAEHVAAGADHACYVRVNGSVACWGSNARGGAAPPAALLTNGSVWWLTAGGGMTCAISGPSVPGVLTCWGSVTGNITHAGYEVACAGWGCVASATGGASANPQVVMAAAVGGSPMPRTSDAVVSTLAGNGDYSYADGVGTLARFNEPAGVFLDGARGLYVADSANHVIRHVDIATRMVTTVAGIAGNDGRVVGATPLQSTFNSPFCVDVDGAGNVYVADTFNNAIRMLSGVWVAGSMSGMPGMFDSPVGTNALFGYPTAVRGDVASELLYVADSSSMIRTINTTRAVATLATLPSTVRDLAVDPAARIVYVSVMNAVFAVTYAGVSTLLAGGVATDGYADGTGSEARFRFVHGLALHAAAGLLYAADFGNSRLRRITTAGGVVTTVAGSGDPGLVDGVGTVAAFNFPVGIALDAVTGALFIVDKYNHAIRQVQLSLLALAPTIFAAAPLPPSSLASTHQLAAWRALGTPNSLGTAAAQPVLDACKVIFWLPMAAANTAGLNPVIGALLLGNVTLVARNIAPAAAGNTNTTFSTSAQRGLRSLTLTTPAVPAAALALPALTSLTLAAPPAPMQALQLANDSFIGLPALTTLALSNANNISWPYLAWLPAVPSLVALDLSGNAITTVNEHDFDAARSLRWLSLANNTVLNFVSDAAFSITKQPVLAVIDQSRTPLVTGSGCRPGSSNAIQLTPVGVVPFVACTPCLAGMSCAGGSSSPKQCRANTFAAGGAAACASCPPGTYAPGAAKDCIACPPGLAAPGCNATASWRDAITLVADDAGAWVNARIYLVPAGSLPTISNVSCSPVAPVSSTTASCALPFLLPALPNAPVLTYVWVAHSGTGGIPQRLNTTVILLPPPQVALAPGGGVGLAPLTPGVGRIALRLPAPRLTAADWTTAGLSAPPQATIDSLAVWLGGKLCTSPAWESSTTLSCGTTATDAINVAVVVQLAGGAFNVSGVLPSLLSTPYLAANVDLQLLPPAQSASNTAVNITLAGVGLCTGTGSGVPQLAAASIAGVPCAAVACISGRPDTALCVRWNVSHPAVDTLRAAGPQAAVNVTVAWVNPASQPVTCAACVTLATRPMLASISPTSIGAPGVAVAVTGTGIMDATRVPPTVLIGGTLCSGVVVLSQTVVQCNAPFVLPSAPGYPAVSVVLVNAAGAASTELVNLAYPATFTVSWTSTPTLAALPGSALFPELTLRVLSRQAATCTLAIDVSSCATPNPAAASRPASMTVATLGAVLAVGSSGSVYAVPTDLLLNEWTVSGASGCAGTLTASCVDSTGQTASTVGQVNPTVALPAWRADWNTAGMPHPFTVVPGELPALTAVFTLLGSGGGGNVTSALASSLSCQALLLSASTNPPALTKSLDLVSPRDVLSSSTAAVGALDASSNVPVVFADLSASAVALGQALSVYAECTWAPTGERVRLPPIALSTAQLALDWVAPPSTVLGFTPLPLHLAATVGSPATSSSGAATAASCEVLLVNATVRGTQVVADTWALNIDGAAPAGTVVATSTNVLLQAAQGVVAFVRVACSAWGQLLASPPLRLTTASLEARITSALPTTFIASDASSPWPVEPPLVVAVVTRHDNVAVTDISCSVSASTPATELVVVDGTSALVSLRTVPADAHTGVVAVPRFVVQTSPARRAVTLVVECQCLASSDAVAPINLTIPATLLTVEQCVRPAATAAVGYPLPAFSVGVAVTPPGGTHTSPCIPTQQAIALPSIVCTIALNASASTFTDASFVFLQQTAVPASTESHVATFGAFTLVAPQGQTYGLTLTCAVGGLAIPPSLPFIVTLAGCRPGQESMSITCVNCRSGTFSLGGKGARCMGCPPAGATCVGGILTLLPHFYRPAAQAGQPLGPDTELHPCHNTAACTLTFNGSDAKYGCAPGYTGPLCGVCDAAANYALFGDACAPCWDPSASAFLVSVVFIVVLALLAHVALFSEVYNKYPDDTIVLRIAMSYLQGIGSLRVFIAGSTQAYTNVMGWTEVVSASPLSMGALQCVLRMSYLTQYAGTVLLPVLAAGIVIIIFLVGTTSRSVCFSSRRVATSPWGTHWWPKWKLRSFTSQHDILPPITTTVAL